MPDLYHTLQGRDLGFIKIVATLWGLDVPSTDTHSALESLTNRLLEPVLVGEVIETLPADAQAALAALIQSEGRLPWPAFSRRFGSIREMGPGQRDRKKPYQNPATPTEALWYRALIGRAFLDSENGPQEYAYIPEDWIPLLPTLENEFPLPPVRPATPAERAVPLPTSDIILDASCTLLSGLRMGWSLEQIPWEDNQISKESLLLLLDVAGLLDPVGIPQPDPTRAFLESSRSDALLTLFQAWRKSPRINDLRLTPGLICEGDWYNDPLAARQVIFDLLQQTPQTGWWSLASFVSVIRERTPDFQRPAGNYDTWFIRDTIRGEYIRGESQWDRVEGELIRYIMTGPLHWTGLIDLAGPEDGSSPSAFRLSAWFSDLLNDRPPSNLPIENAPLFTRSNGIIRLSNMTPRAARYQISRFAEWLPSTHLEFSYRVTPASLERARRQGLRTGHLIALLRKFNAGPVPLPFTQALERWEQSGVQARLEPVTLLRVSSPDILAALKRSQAARFLGDPLGPTTVIIQPGAQVRVMAVLAEMGYLAEGDWDPPA